LRTAAQSAHLLEGRVRAQEEKVAAVGKEVQRRADVAVDPHVAFGLPVVVEGGARVEDLVDGFLAGDTIGDIADDFAVPVDQVEDGIRVTTRTAA
jgi:uncharacterized protein (DUF433 family)